MYIKPVDLMEYLHIYCEEIAPSLSFIFQASLQQPIDWKEANVIPLFKKRVTDPVLVTTDLCH